MSPSLVGESGNLGTARRGRSIPFAGVRSFSKPARNGCWGHDTGGNGAGGEGAAGGEYAAQAGAGRDGGGESAAEKKSHGRRLGGRYVRLTAAEKAEVIRLVEGSDLSVRRTLAELGVHRSTFYAWYRRYTEAGAAGLVRRANTPFIGGAFNRSSQ